MRLSVRGPLFCVQEDLEVWLPHVVLSSSSRSRAHVGMEDADRLL